MSISVFCSGCGDRFLVDDAYRRRKARCPSCGVMCEVPQPREEKVAAASSAKPAQPTRPIAPALSKEAGLQELEAFACPRCGHEVKDRAYSRRQKVACPHCGASLEEPSSRSQLHGSSPPPAPMSATAVADDDDGRPYGVAASQDQRCPQCNRILAVAAKVCDYCGFDLQTSQPAAKKVYEKLERQWEAGLPFHKRLRLFIALEGTFLALSLLSAILGRSWLIFIDSSLLASSLLVFVLGTYPRLDLERNRRGQVRLTKTWRVCFRQWRPDTIAWHKYEGVVTGMVYEVDFWDWLVFIILLLFGIVPGLVWWYCMHKESCFVALSKDHGFPERTLYHGWSQEHMEDIAKTLHEVTGLPKEGK